MIFLNFNQINFTDLFTLVGSNKLLQSNIAKNVRFLERRA